MRNTLHTVKLGSIIAVLGFGCACTRNEPTAKTHAVNAAVPAAPAPVAERTNESNQTQESTAGQQAAGEATGTEAAGSATDQPEARTPDVVYVPTPQPVVDKMLELVKLKKSDVVYDLGCGDGRIVVTAAKKYGTKAYGFDIDPERVAEARENVKKNKVEHLVTIEQKDIFTLDLSPADVVTLYLLPRLNVKLIPQLQKLKPGSRVVSHDFDMQGVTPLKHLSLRPQDESRDHEVYLWKAPIRLDSEVGKPAAQSVTP
ncbi:MAG TPA: methyltransferase domain-containing protein [Polyangiaceae bacterium]|nr:methyltransferase domain-containing protein [Polyangiaceae bacterium]